MPDSRKRSLLESLVFAGALGIIALFIAASGILADSRRAAFDREALSALAKRPVSSDAFVARDREPSRVYRIGGKGESLFGLVFPLRTSKGVSLAVGLFAPNGELQALRLVGVKVARQPHFYEDWTADFLGKGGSKPYPSSKTEARDPIAVSGASETFLAIAETLDRASASIRLAAKERP